MVRVYNGHIMVALIETTSELGSRRAARGCRVVAGGHQGGTGIAVGGVGYSGAAAQSRCLGTGFRAVDAISGLGLSPNALHINGADTYQFVMGNPVGMVDASGQSATIELQLGSPTQGLPLAYPTPESVPIPSTPGMPSLGVSPWTGFNPPPVPSGPPGVAFLNGYDPTPAGVGVGLGGVSIGDLAGAQLHNLELQQTLAGQPPWGDVWEGRLGTWPNSPVSWDNGGGEPSTGAYLNALFLADGLIGDLGEALGGLAGDGLRALRGLLDDVLARPPCPDVAGNETAGVPASSPVGRSGEPIKIQPGTNEPATIAGRGYSGHAPDQVQGRGIPPSAVENTIQNGVPSPGNQPGRTAYYDPVNNPTVITGSASGRVITVRQGEP